MIFECRWLVYHVHGHVQLYMADITTEAERTFRIGVLTLCMQIAVPIGLSVSGILLK